MPAASPKPTSHDVARLAGVSQTTVSYVMSGRRPVASDTEQRVREAMNALGYRPHSGARALRSQRSRMLGVVVPYRAGIDAASQHRFLVALARHCRLHDYDLMVVTADEGVTGLRRVVDTALCDGLLIMEVLAGDPRAGVVAGSGLPAVFIGLPGPGATVDPAAAQPAGTPDSPAEVSSTVGPTTSAAPAPTDLAHRDPDPSDPDPSDPDPGGPPRPAPASAQPLAAAPGPAADETAPGQAATGSTTPEVTATDADYWQAGETAVRTLAGRGHERLVVVVPASEELGRLNFVQRFLSGVGRAASQERVAVDYHAVAPTFPAASRALEDLDGHEAFLLAPMCPADDWCNALARRGRPPGSAVSLLAASWDPASPHSAWQPAHFDTRPDEVARTAVELLVERLTASPVPPPRTVVVPAPLHEGDTLRP